ncbi:MAG: hypothetical protein LBN95_02495 [Prevotellaceae bacterium]|jgi:hypothetical protein|nr:hypothetical protein [Prevotellaceae bacterium]
MKQYIFISILLFLTINLFSQTHKDFKYAPKTLEDAIIQLDKIFDDSIKANIKTMSENEFVKQYSNSVGKTIVKKWLSDKYFWEFVVKKSALKQDLFLKDIYFSENNNDVLSVILRSYYRHLNNTDILLEQQIDSIYQEYKNGKRIPMLICYTLISANYILTSDIHLKYLQLIHKDFKIEKTLLILNGIIVRDTLLINCFRNHFDKKNIKSIKKLSKSQAEQLKIKDVCEDGVLIITTKKDYYFELKYHTGADLQFVP